MKNRFGVLSTPRSDHFAPLPAIAFRRLLDQQKGNGGTGRRFYFSADPAINRGL